MVEPELLEGVKETQTVDGETFENRAAEEAKLVREAVDEGVFDNPQGLVGLEHEFHAVANRADTGAWISPEEADEAGSLARVPRRLLEYIGFEKELGLHNAELSTTPQPLNRHGLRAQEREIVARMQAAQETIQAHGLRLVSDGVWTVPPTGESSREYLTDYVTIDGLRFATNMSASPRYHAMSNATPQPSMAISVPHATLDADTVLPESLITSIQPHYQVPNARDLPTYFRYAVRIAGPLLAVSANAPLLPPDLYDDGADPDAILSHGHDEHRIAIFEQMMNSPEAEKVRFPHDVGTVSEALDAIVADPTLVPADLDTGGNRYDDQFAHLRHKHGTYWRWVRPVFGGASRSAANARVEFRPLPAQPTIRDTVGILATVVGLMSGLRREDHPVRELDWERARQNFYDAAEDGLDAEIHWVTGDGEPTTDLDRVYDDLFGVASRGLRSQGIPTEEVERYLAPLRARVEHRTTPADWKRARVRKLLDSASFTEAVHGAQGQYFERQADTLFEGSFVDWL